MPKRKRNVDRHNEIEDFTFIDIPTINSTSATPTTVSESQVINVAEWHIDGNRVSTSNTLTTTIIETQRPLATTLSDDCHGESQSHQSDPRNAYSDLFYTDTYADVQAQSASTEGSQNVQKTNSSIVIPALTSDLTGLPNICLAQGNQGLFNGVHTT